MECRSGNRRSSCSHTGRPRRPVSGAPRSSGKRRSRKAMISSSAACVGRRSCVSGSTSDAVLVVGELDAAAFEVGKAVEDVAAVEVGPARHGAGQEAAVAGGRREIEDFLPGRRRCVLPRTSGKIFGSQGRARRRSGRPPALADRKLTARACRAARRQRERRAWPIFAAGGDEPRRPASAPARRAISAPNSGSYMPTSIPPKSIIGKRRGISRRSSASVGRPERGALPAVAEIAPRSGRRTARRWDEDRQAGDAR